MATLSLLLPLCAGLTFIVPTGRALDLLQLINPTALCIVSKSQPDSRINSYRKYVLLWRPATADPEFAWIWERHLFFLGRRTSRELLFGIT